MSAISAPAGLHGAPLFLVIALAQWTVFLGPVVLLWLWLAGAEDDRAAAVAAGVAAVLGLLGAAAVSSVVTLPRPFMDGPAVNYLDHLRDGSFPSDHATFMFSLVFAFLVRRPPTMPSVWLSLLAAAVIVGWARVYLNAHYPWDIVGGALFGATATALTMATPFRSVERGLVRCGEAVRSLAIARWRRAACARAAGGPNS